jgi:hypothetical protein
MQLPPVVSSSGFLEVGIEIAHCHQLALSVLKESGPANAILRGMMSPKPITTVVMNFLVLFMTSSVWNART